MIRLAKKTFLGRTKTRLELWRELLEDQLVASEKVPKSAFWFELSVASRVGCSGLQLCGHQDFPKDA